MDSGSCNEGAGHYGSQTEHRFHRWHDGSLTRYAWNVPRLMSTGSSTLFREVPTTGEAVQRDNRKRLTVDLTNSARTDLAAPKVTRLHAEIPAARPHGT